MGKKYFSLIIFIMMIFCLSSISNAATNDNKYTIADTSLVNNYIKSYFENKSYDPFAIYNVLEALELAKKIKYQKGIDEIERSLKFRVQSLKLNYDLRFILNNDVNLYMTLYDSLGYYYLKDGQEDKALECFRSIEELASKYEISINERLKKSELNGIAGCYRRIGLQYTNQKDYEISIEYQNKALKIYKGLGNRIGMGKCYNNMGAIYITIGNNFLALDNLLKALKIYEDLENKTGIANSNINIAIVYVNEKDYSKALDYVQRAFSKYKEIKDKEGILKYYYISGSIYSHQSNYIKAIEYYNRALQMSEELQDKITIDRILNDIGDAYINLGDYSKALEYFNKALKLNKKNEDKITKLYILDNIANTNLKLKRYDEALKYVIRSSKSAKELRELVIENDGYRILKEIYKIKGNSNKALEYAELYKSTADSLYSLNKNKQILEIQSKYESEKKESRILGLEKEKQIQNLKYENLKGNKKNQVIFFSIIIFCLFLVIILILVLYNRYKLKQKNIIEKEIAKQRELRYHDVIEAQENERKRIAEDLHDSLGQILSTIKLQIASVEGNSVFDSAENHKALKNSMNYLDEACLEVRNVSHHMMPHDLIRFGLIPALSEMMEIINKTHKIRINFTKKGLQQRFNESIEINVFRMMQEVIGNVIKHSQATEMDIDISQKNELVTLTIRDNGKGFDITKIKNSKGIGWKNIYSRLAILNGKIDISSEINKGTKICINFAV